MHPKNKSQDQRQKSSTASRLRVHLGDQLTGKGDQLTGKGDQLTGGHGRHGWGTLDTVGEVAWLRSTWGGCESLKKENNKKWWRTDFPFVDLQGSSEKGKANLIFLFAITWAHSRQWRERGRERYKWRWRRIAANGEDGPLRCTFDRKLHAEW